MAKKLHSLKAELLAIKTICEYGDQRAGQFLLAKLGEDFFATEIARASWGRITHSLRKNGFPPDWNSLVTDPGLDETIREALDEVDYDAISSKKRVNALVDRLNEYRKNRVLLDIGRMLDKRLNSSEPFDTDDTIKSIQDKLAGSTKLNTFKVVHIGTGSNVEKHVKRILSGTALTYIPTGFKGFDEKNRGLISGSFIIFAGETGAGKSALLGSIANNMALSGAKVAMVPLEMTNDEVLQRDVARNTEVSLNELIDPENRISKKQRMETYDRFMRHDKRIERHGGRISYYEFDSDVTAEGLFSTLQPYGYDVIILDYIGLLAGLDGDDQWRAMNNVCRYGKVWARNNGVIVIVAAQLSKEGMLKYAKGMADHANNCWIWSRDEVFQTTGVAVIKQPKARQQSNHDFYLKFDFPKMLVRDADDDDLKAFEAGSKSRDKDGKRRKRWEEESDVSDNSWDEPKKSKKKDSDEQHASRGSRKVVI